MRNLFVCAALFIAITALFLPAYALQLCEEQDLYGLSDPYCVLEYKKKTKQEKVEASDVMFDIMKTYPYEKKGKFVKFLQKKVEMLDSSISQLQKQESTFALRAKINDEKRARRILATQRDRVEKATEEEWEQVRDQARKALQEADKILSSAEKAN